MSDPMVVVFQEALSGSIEVGRTEMMKDCHDPDFSTHITLDYFFEEIQKLTFHVLDVDDFQSRDLNKQEFIGSFSTTLASIVTARGQQIVGGIRNRTGQDRGHIIVRAEELQDLKDILVVQFSAQNLPKRGWFGLSRPSTQLVLSRVRESGDKEVVHRTEVYHSSQHPLWSRFEMPVVKLCNGDHHRPIVIECFEANASIIGNCQTSLDDILKPSTSFPLLNPLKRNAHTGAITVQSAELRQTHSLFDYIAGGAQISLHVAIDFTSSNGEAYDPSSLHYNRGTSPTAYEQAIWAVGEVLAPYDSDGIIPVYGFGAYLQNSVNHCFPLVPGGCHGVQAIAEAYRNTLNNVRLHGPTIFSHVINKVAEEAQAARGTRNYTLLLIITDGVLTDTDSTLNSIISASELPMSIVIVGVGNASFDAMEMLDGDNGLLRHGGRVAKRDIVQFVPFNQYVGNPARLAKAVLEEIPDQYLGYMKSYNLAPSAPTAAEAFDLG